MINIKELKGQNIKKACGLIAAVKRWHNHNNSGGNFGINLITGKKQDYEITGYHNLDGNITNLSFGFLYRAGVHVPEKETMDFNALMTFMNRIIEKGSEP